MKSGSSIKDRHSLETHRKHRRCLTDKRLRMSATKSSERFGFISLFGSNSRESETGRNEGKG